MSSHTTTGNKTSTSGYAIPNQIANNQIPLMKIVILLVLLFFCFKNISAQEYDTNSKKAVKHNKVKKSFNYYFQSKSDSSLNSLYCYDTLGNLLYAKTFDKNGIVASGDTMIYDTNHYLVKKIHSDGQKKEEYDYTNDNTGNIKQQISAHDSLTFRSVLKYDENGHWIKSVSYINGDSTIMKASYNEKNLLKRVTTYNKQNGLSTIDYSYDIMGNIQHRKITDSFSINFYDYKYDSKRNNTEVKTTMVYKNNSRNKTYKSKYNYYPNGLVYEELSFINDKQISWKKIYYTYY